jgi:hypothetical protein
MSYSITLQRVIGKRTSDEKVQKQITKILERATDGSRARTWTGAFVEVGRPHQTREGWCFTYRLSFDKEHGHRGGEAEYKQWETIKDVVYKCGQNACFLDQKWNIIAIEAADGTQEALPDNAPEPVLVEAGTTATVDPEFNAIEPAGFGDVLGSLNAEIKKLRGVREVQPHGLAKTWSELDVPDNLLGENSDEHIAAHPAWKNLYGVNPQIRILLSNIKRAKDTEGESRNHSVLFGHTGCGKSTALFALEKMFGSESVLKLDATSTTKAGLEKLFFSELTEIPPLVFMEEAEKADPEALKIWLGALDDRGEIRKINFRTNQLRSIKVLFICSVNDKAAFDRMMGSNGKQAGALSSRCVTQLYFPRPSEAILYQILEKEINEKGGRHEWILPAIEMAKTINVTDPRVVRSFLAGGDRLLSKQYQEDWLIIYKEAQNFNSGDE